MSHFSVLVVTPSKPSQEDLARILQPWHEYESTGVKDQYVVFVDHTEEVDKAWNEDTQERWVGPDGEFLNDWDTKTPLWRKPTPEEDVEIRKAVMIPFGSTGGKTENGLRYTFHGDADGKGKVFVFEPPAEYVKRNVPVRELFESKKQYTKDWLGYGDALDGKIGCWTNQQKKWDWWVIGGRYSDRLTFKAGDTGDQAAVADLDLEAMRKTKVANARKDIEAGITASKLSLEAGLALWKSAALLQDKTRADWQSGTEEQKGKAFHEYITALPEDHPVRKARDCGLLSNIGDFGAGVPETEPDPFAWADAMPPLTTYAIVKDGNWYEKGEMGWFGMAANEKPESDWRAFVGDTLGSLQPTDWITIVDCHI